MATPIPRNQAAFSLREVLDATGGTLVSRGDLGENEGFRGVSTDTRALSVTTGPQAVSNLGPLGAREAGALFVALRGDSFDAHDHLAAAVAGGAKGLLIEREVFAPPTCALVRVSSTLEALGQLARWHARKWRALGGIRKVIAITGSAGKTTTRVAAQALLEKLHPGEVHATKGNLNNLVGAPMVLFGLGSEHRYAVVELGTNRPGEIEALARMTEADVGVVTLVAAAHVEELGSVEGVAHEKGALFRALPAEGVAIGNGDNELVRAQIATSPARTQVLYGTREGASVRMVERAPKGLTASRVRIEVKGRETEDGMGREARGQGRDARVSVSDAEGQGHEARAKGPDAEDTGRAVIEIVTPLLGEAGALACAAAISIAEFGLGDAVSAAVANEAFAAVEVGGGAGRLVPVSVGRDVVVIDDSYNANPASMRASIRAASEIAAAERRRLVLVLGEMRELGSAAEVSHDEVGDAARASGAGLVIAVGPLAGRFTTQLLGSAITHVHVDTAQDAAAFARTWIQPGDLVLVKGSRGIGTDAVVRALREHFGAGSQGADGVEVQA